MTLLKSTTASKESVFGICPVLIFPHSDRIRTKKLGIQKIFTQCSSDSRLIYQNAKALRSTEERISSALTKKYDTSVL